MYSARMLRGPEDESSENAGGKAWLQSHVEKIMTASARGLPPRHECQSGRTKQRKEIGEFGSLSQGLGRRRAYLDARVPEQKAPHSKRR